jgi:hypothetical protein
MAEGNIYPSSNPDQYGYSPRPLVKFNNGINNNVYPTSNPDNYMLSGVNLPTPVAQPNPASQGMTSAEAQMVGNIGSGLIGAGANIGMGLLQTSENDKSREESRNIAMRNRDDQLKQEKIDLGYRKRQQELEEQAFETNKRIEKYNTKFSIWQNTFKQELEKQQGAVSAADELFSLYNTSDEKTQQALIRSFI